MFWKKKDPSTSLGARKRIYLDYVAGAPMRPEAKKKMLEAFDVFGNPGTLHAEGLTAKKMLQEAREKIAAAIFSRNKEIIFTSGATESNNIAIFGSVFACPPAGGGGKPHIITTQIEHPSVLEICKHLEHKGIAEVTYLPVSPEGIVDLKKLRESLRPETVIVSVIFASNEIGVMEPLGEISKEIRHFKKHILGNHEAKYPLLHTDASQAPLYAEVDLRTLHVDLLTMSSEKIGGPSGVGALFVKSGTKLEKILMGGSQEMNLRPGTENIAGIVGFAEALQLAVSEREASHEKVCTIQNYCFEELEKNFSGKFIVNGSRENRLPNNVNVTFADFDSELLVIELDAKGIAVSEKSACNPEDSESYVIESLRPGSASWRNSAIRISFSVETSKSDIDAFILALKEIFAKYESLKS